MRRRDLAFEVCFAGLCAAFFVAVVLLFGCGEATENAPRTAAEDRNSESCATKEHAIMAPPPGMSATTLAELTRLYQRAGDDVNAIAGKAMLRLADDPQARAPQFALARAGALARAIDERLALLDRQAHATLQPAIIASQSRAIAFARAQAKEVRDRQDEINGRRGGGPNDGSIGAGWIGINDDAIRALAEDSASVAGIQIRRDLGIAAAQHGDQAQAMFRRLGESIATRSIAARADTERAVNTAIARALITGNRDIARREIRTEIGRAILGDDAPESFRKLGDQIIQVGNATLSLRAYAYTVSRTRTAEAANRAIVERYETLGFDAGIVTGRITENFCTAYVGLIVGFHGPVVIDGRTYPAIAELGGPPPWHPNCSKTVLPFEPAVATSAQLRAARDALAGYGEDQLAA